MATPPRPTHLHTVVSGGQTGADQAALRAALTSNLTTGGWCPPGRTCEDGIIPEEFSRLRETPLERSDGEGRGVARSMRTEWNVRDSDATLVFRTTSSLAAAAAGDEDDGASPTTVADPGTEWTLACAARLSRPALVVDPANSRRSSVDGAAEIAAWIREVRAGTLNVAGPSEGTRPGIGELVYDVLVKAFAEVK